MKLSIQELALLKTNPSTYKTHILLKQIRELIKPSVQKLTNNKAEQDFLLHTIPRQYREAYHTHKFQADTVNLFSTDGTTAIMNNKHGYPPQILKDKQILLGTFNQKDLVLEDITDAIACQDKYDMRYGLYMGTDGLMIIKHEPIHQSRNHKKHNTQLKNQVRMWNMVEIDNPVKEASRTRRAYQNFRNGKITNTEYEQIRETETRNHIKNNSNTLSSSLEDYLNESNEVDFKVSYNQRL